MNFRCPTLVVAASVVIVSIQSGCMVQKEDPNVISAIPGESQVTQAPPVSPATPAEKAPETSAATPAADTSTTTVTEAPAPDATPNSESPEFREIKLAPNGEPATSEPVAAPTRDVPDQAPIVIAKIDTPQVVDPITPSPVPTRSPVDEKLSEAQGFIREGQIVRARTTMNALLSMELTADQGTRVREIMTNLNDTIMHDRTVHEGDSLSQLYIVVQGDTLSHIGSRFSVPWQYIADVNEIRPPKYVIQIGQRLKVPVGPFHVKISKSAYRLDLYLQDTYVRSFKVGVGENDSTPVGKFKVRSNSKLENPTWYHPRTGKKFDADDPANPIGEYWIGLEGIADNTSQLRGYGIHGTNQPDSVGTQSTMGGISLSEPDVAFLFNALVGGKSEVEVLP